VNEYHVGDLVRLTATFTNAAGSATDPTTVTCLVKLRHVHGAATQSYTYAGGTVIKDATGVYHVDVSPTTEGTWDYRWIGTGTVQAADEGAFRVPESYFY
jgi:hypothetical protein